MLTQTDITSPSLVSDDIRYLKAGLGVLVEHLTHHATITGKVISLDKHCPLCAHFNLGEAAN